MQYSRPVQVTFSTILIISIGKPSFHLSGLILLDMFFNLVSVSQEAIAVYIRILECNLIHPLFSGKMLFY